MDFRLGMNEVYSPPSGQTPVATIVLVHGLFGGPWKTWAAKVKSPRSNLMRAQDPTSSASSVDGPTSRMNVSSKHVFWPESLLPSAVDNVKVYSFGYDADVERFMSSAGLNTVHQHGRNLFNELLALRSSQIPIIIVAHSLGGLVVKEALNQAAHSAQEDERNVVSNTSGIIFLGTPHSGSNAASYGRVAYTLTKIFAFQSANTKLLTALEKNSETLDRISTAFYQTLENYKNLRIASFSEEKQVRVGPVGMQIVRPDSAKIGHARETWGSISEDHRNMAKYTTARDDGFVKVSRKILEWVGDIQGQMSLVEAKSYEECLNSLNDPAARFRVQEVEPVRHYNKETFEWLFTDQVSFSRWLSDDKGEFDAIFWITGKPGSGKSTLMRFALEDSRTMSLQPSSSKGDPMAYFFHLRGKSLVQKSLRGMLMELLYQVLEQYLRSFQLIRPTFMNLKRLKQDWDIRSLSQAMLQIPHIPPAVPGRRDRVTLFVDALDENQNQDDNNNLLSIFERLNATYRSVRVKPDAPVLKICLASRPWPIFRQRLGDDVRVPSFAIHDFTRNDVERYTKSQLFTTTTMLKASCERKSAISKLSSDIASRAKGVFIWVRVVVDSLRQDIIDGTPIESLRGILHKYPEELDEMYKFTLKRVRGGYRPETLILFKAMLASRVPLTALQLYTITHICMSSPQPNPDPTESSDDILSWLASRSGGLIELVTTGGEEPLGENPDPTESSDDILSWLDIRSSGLIELVTTGGADPPHPAAPGTGVEKPFRETRLETPIRLDPHAEFLHQTVQDFVRNSLDDALRIVEPTSSVAQLSGPRLLALACLDRHPPHNQLRDLAEDIFSYIREVEREEDGSKRQQMTCLPHWNSFNLHDFPFHIRQPHKLPPKPTSREMFRYYVDTNNALVRKIVLQPPRTAVPLHSQISAVLAPFVVTILNNLYRTQGPENFSKLDRDHSPGLKHVLLFIASVGPRLSNDRVDRPRMFQHILTSYLATPLRGPDWNQEYLSKYHSGLWPYRRITEPIDHVSLSKPSLSLASILACSKPSIELDDDTLLSFVQKLDGQFGYDDIISVEVPEKNTMQGQYELASIGQTVNMTLPAFCSRFRDINRSNWTAQFLKSGTDGLPPLRVRFVGAPDFTEPAFVDLAVWDAAGLKPPPHAYTQFAEEGNVVAQVMASACMPAALVGGGGSRVFKAFYKAYTPMRRVVAIPEASS